MNYMRWYKDFGRQIFRFGIFGLVSNGLLYLLYLSLTAVNVGHKTAMTLVFSVGALQTFVFNKRWTFDHQGFVKLSFSKYLCAYCFCFFINLLGLSLFVDFLGYPHEIIQGVMVFFVGIMLFVLQRYWVFRVTNSFIQ